MLGFILQPNLLLNAIENVIEKIQARTLDRFQYDPNTASLIE
jgi:hypothetical protein